MHVFPKIFHFNHNFDFNSVEMHIYIHNKRIRQILVAGALLRRHSVNTCPCFYNIFPYLCKSILNTSVQIHFNTIYVQIQLIQHIPSLANILHIYHNYILFLFLFLFLPLFDSKFFWINRRNVNYIQYSQLVKWHNLTTNADSLIKRSNSSCYRNFRILYFEFLNIHRWFNINNTVPYSPGDGLLEPKHYSVDFAFQ